MMKDVFTIDSEIGTKVSSKPQRIINLFKTGIEIVSLIPATANSIAGR